MSKKNKHIDQTIYTSDVGGMRTDYKIVSHSPGLSTFELEEISLYSDPGQFLPKDYIAYQLYYFERRTNETPRIAFSKVLEKGADAEGRDRRYIHSLLVDQKTIADINFNPFTLISEFQYIEMPPAQLPLLHIKNEESKIKTSFSDLLRNLKTNDTFERDLLYVLDAVMSENRNTLIVAEEEKLQYLSDIIELAYLLLPNFARKRFTFATFVDSICHKYKVALIPDRLSPSNNSIIKAGYYVFDHTTGFSDITSSNYTEHLKKQNIEFHFNTIHSYLEFMNMIAPPEINYVDKNLTVLSEYWHSFWLPRNIDSKLVTKDILWITLQHLRSICTNHLDIDDFFVDFFDIVRSDEFNILRTHLMPRYLESYSRLLNYKNDKRLNR